MEREEKWVVAGAWHHPSGYEDEPLRLSTQVRVEGQMAPIHPLTSASVRNEITRGVNNPSLHPPNQQH